MKQNKTQSSLKSLLKRIHAGLYWLTPMNSLRVLPQNSQPFRF